MWFYLTWLLSALVSAPTPGTSVPPVLSPAFRARQLCYARHRVLPGRKRLPGLVLPVLHPGGPGQRVKVLCYSRQRYSACLRLALDQRRPGLLDSDLTRAIGSLYYTRLRLTRHHSQVHDRKTQVHLQSCAWLPGHSLDYTTHRRVRGRERGHDRNLPALLGNVSDHAGRWLY